MLEDVIPVSFLPGERGRTGNDFAVDFELHVG